MTLPHGWTSLTVRPDLAELSASGNVDNQSYSSERPEFWGWSYGLDVYAD